ncbi:MAG: hypothetical protein KAH17_08150 [Bacteroidales bacterium]|nr:hypothetical protein [Bacteroidales bacterium]
MNRALCTIGCVMLFLTIFNGCEDTGNSTASGSRSNLPYTIVLTDTANRSGSSYITIKAIVHSNSAPSDQSLIDIADVIYPQYVQYNHLRVFLYPPNGDIESVAYCRIEYANGAMISATIQYDSSLWD